MYRIGKKKKLTQDSWGLAAIQGYKIVFIQPYSTGNPKDSREQGAGHLYFGGGLVTPQESGDSPNPMGRSKLILLNCVHYSKDGRWSLPDNQALNRFIPHVHFKKEGIQLLENNL